MIARLRRQARQVAGRAAVPAGGAGYPRRRPAEQRAVPVHAARRRSLAELNDWAPKITAALEKLRQLTDVNSDQQQHGLETDLVIDRPTAARLGLTTSQIDNTLYDAFGQRQVSVIYTARNQYHVVMEVAPQFWQSPDMLKQIYVSTTGGAVKGTQATNAVAGTVAASTVAKGSSTAANTAATVAADAARNQATNALASTGHSARLDRRAGQHRSARPWCRSRPSRITGRARRRSRSTIRGCSSPARSRSTSSPAHR